MLRPYLSLACYLGVLWSYPWPVLAATRCYDGLGCYESLTLHALPQEPSHLRTEYRISCRGNPDHSVIKATDTDTDLKNKIGCSPTNRPPDRAQYRQSHLWTGGVRCRSFESGQDYRERNRQGSNHGPFASEADVLPNGHCAPLPMPKRHGYAIPYRMDRNNLIKLTGGPQVLTQTTGLPAGRLDVGLVILQPTEAWLATHQSCFSVGKPVRFITHGFRDSASAPWVTRMRNAFLAKEDCNVIAVDWHHGAPFPYEQAVANSFLVARQIGHLIRHLELVHTMRVCNKVLKHTFPYHSRKKVKSPVGISVESVHFYFRFRYAHHNKRPKQMRTMRTMRTSTNEHNERASPAREPRVNDDLRSSLGASRWPAFKPTKGERGGPRVEHRLPTQTVQVRDDFATYRLGLDPAEPYFDSFNDTLRLDQSDAIFVDVIHTDGERFTGYKGYGSLRQQGHVDFYPNGGQQQPGCGSASLGSAILQGISSEEGIGCSHHRAIELFIRSIEIGPIPTAQTATVDSNIINTNSNNNVSTSNETSHCMLWGNPKCPSWEMFEAGNCTSCPEDGCVPLGYHADSLPGVSGQIFLSTSAEYPFCGQDYVISVIVASGQKRAFGRLELILKEDSSASGSTIDFSR
ncbi:hypothetical protein EGW08_006801 [Elysia chlorotica]|uniref:Lipase domain-containing protein n=1 Tax=Elysia chlorotica TaxID=188477 RepID=A0A433TV07_ELYCH|nr:hypothetical protein EGW08_006801 [Elysia chlorotica]